VTLAVNVQHSVISITRGGLDLVAIWTAPMSGRGTRTIGLSGLRRIRVKSFYPFMRWIHCHVYMHRRVSVVHNLHPDGHFAGLAPAADDQAHVYHDYCIILDGSRYLDS